jgi:hypothetical protein
MSATLAISPNSVSARFNLRAVLWNMDIDEPSRSARQEFHGLLRDAVRAVGQNDADGGFERIVWDVFEYAVV